MIKPPFLVQHYKTSSAAAACNHSANSTPFTRLYIITYYYYCVLQSFKTSQYFYNKRCADLSTKNFHSQYQRVDCCFVIIMCLLLLQRTKMLTHVILVYTISLLSSCSAHDVSGLVFKFSSRVFGAVFATPTHIISVL